MLVIDNSYRNNTLINDFAVYRQQNRVLNFEEFRKTQGFLAYSRVNSTNYGLTPNGVWLYTKLENQSDIEDWHFSIRFSQLQKAQLVLLQQGDIIYQSTDGIQDKTSPYPLPSFDVNLPKNTPLELYIYVQSNSLSLVAPIYLQTPTAKANVNLVDFSLWGMFYGVLIILLLYACIFIVFRQTQRGFAYISNLVVLLMFQLLWSGHAALFPTWLSTFYFYVRAENVVLLMNISSILLNLLLIPLEKQQAKMALALQSILIASVICFFLFFIPGIPDIFKLVITYCLGFSAMLINGLFSYKAHAAGFKPGKALVVAWILPFIGATLSAFYIFNVLPSNMYHHHIFHSTLVLQVSIFLIAMVLRNQYDLQLDIEEAETDALNNFLMIEEQNVHLDLARKQAIKASDVKSQFLANMSHEIRTPLNAIMGFSKELETEQNESEREEHSRIINSAAGDLLTIVNDILDFSKMEAGKLSLSTRPFSPRDTLEDVVALMAKNAHLKQLELLYDAGELPDFLLGDALKLKQLLSNLLSNAIKFTNYGQISLSVKVIEQTDDNCVLEFIVSDTGIGISQEDIDKLFNAFHQLDDELNRSYQGTGLGLVICQEITDLMGGLISVNSEPSKGSAFSATIPFAIDHSATQLKPKHKYKGQTAYLLDLWEESRRTANLQLNNAGFQVVIADSLASLLNEDIQDHEYVFVALPYKHVDRRSQVIEALANRQIYNIVFMYSGPQPNKNSFIKLAKLPILIRMPLTGRKLEDLDSNPNKAKPNKHVHSLNALPAVRMLAVDDIELNLHLIYTWLSSSPVKLDLAYDGKTAIELCQENDYDLILMDIQMPNMDGLETTKHIRKSELNIGTPIVAVTAHALETEKEHYLNSGMDDFLSKPIRVEDLINIINTWCDEREHKSSFTGDSIDWPLAIQRAGNEKEAALSFFDSFVERLQTHANEIESGWQQQRTDLLVESIHKLHGACCYTGVPKLQEYCQQAETMLKTEGLENNSAAISNLLLEIERVAEQWMQNRQTIENSL